MRSAVSTFANTANISSGIAIGRNITPIICFGIFQLVFDGALAEKRFENVDTIAVNKSKGKRFFLPTASGPA